MNSVTLYIYAEITYVEIHDKCLRSFSQWIIYSLELTNSVEE
jgi:hypothetical protein